MEQYQEQYKHIKEQYENETKKIRGEETTVYANIEQQRKAVKIALIAGLLMLAVLFGILALSFDEEAPREMIFGVWFINFSIPFSIAILAAKVKGDRANNNTLFEISREKISLEDKYKKQRRELQSAINSAVSSTVDVQKKARWLEHINRD